jgi:hypothetical protein
VREEKMPEVREEDMKETIPIPMRPIVPAIPTDDADLRQLGEDLRKMGCEGLLAQPWNVQDDKVLREFKFPRGNQWLRTKRREPECGYVGEGLRIPERSWRRVGWPERWPVPGEI